MSGLRTARPDNSLAVDRRHARAYAAARRHSLLVRFLKVALPGGAILTVGGIAAASLLDPMNKLPGLSVGPVSFSGSKIAMESPRMSGMRKDKRPYEVTAVAAFQDIRKPNIVELKDMKARLAIDVTGTVGQLEAKTGVLDTGREHLDLSQDVHFWTDRGEEAFLQTASIEMKTGNLVTADPVRVRTPTLAVDAQAMQISDNGKTVVFTGRVRTEIQRQDAVDGSGAVAAAGAPAGAAVASGPTPSARLRQAEAEPTR